MVQPRHAGLFVVARPTVDALFADCLDHVRAHTPADPFTPVTIGVQSRGMARWLSHRLADTINGPDGVTANIDFAFPGQIIDQLVVASGAGVAAEVWDARALTWHVADILLSRHDDPTLASLWRATDTVVHRSLWQLARGIADVFHDYALSRVDMVQAWRDGHDVDAHGGPLEPWDAWQPALWRYLIARSELPDPTAALDMAIANFRTNRSLDVAGLQDGLLLFGLNVLPPRHLALLDAVAAHVPVTWFVPTVCHDFWQRHAATPEGDVVANNPLVAASGHMIRVSAHLLADVVAAGNADVAYVPDDQPTLLGQLQQAVRDDRGGDEPPVRVACDDASVQIHGAHSATRQADIARDAILGVLAENDDLQPRDVIVLVPNIDAYAPVITAAFASDGKRPELPVVVADRNIGASDPVADAVLALLRVAAGRVTTADVLELLDREPVAARLALTAADREHLRSWVAATGIRWGIDREDRRTHGQPADDFHTWRSGLDRLLLGVAVTADDDTVIGGIAPYDAMEGDDVAALGRVAAALEHLFSVVRDLRGTRSLPQWAAAVRDVLDSTIQVDDVDTWRLTDVVDAIEASTQGREITADLAAFTASLEDHLAIPRGAAGYESGAVTLCEFLPMRSIPHAVVCMVGLDDAAFPRAPRRRGFNLIERSPEPTDRDRRDEDRHLFLEAILAAQRQLIITATTRSMRTNEPVNPSVLVTELCEMFDRTVHCDHGSVVDHRVTHHPLHPFSPRNFGADEDAFSFDVAAADAAMQLHIQTSAPSPLTIKLPPAEDSATCSLADLTSAITAPVRYFFERRLNVFLREWVDELDDVEPLEITPLQRSRLMSDAVQRAREGDLAAWRSVSAAAGHLPAATPGVDALDTLEQTVNALVERLDSDGARLGVNELSQAYTSVALDVPIGPLRLRGDVQAVVVDDAAIVVHIVPYTDRAERRLDAWVRHLAASATWGRVATVSVHAADSKSLQMHRYIPLAESPEAASERARALLTDLIDIRRQAQRQLVPLFARASAAQAAKGFPAAAEAFESANRDGIAYDRDVYVRQAFGQDCTLQDIVAEPADYAHFERLAATVWGARLKHRVSYARELASAFVTSPAAGSA